jgi:FYVE zinc finger/Zinc finger, C3HC4 type (RING finger)
MVIRQESKRASSEQPAAGGEWVAFEHSSSTFASIERKSGSGRSSSRSRASSKWMQQPISTDASWTPIAAPSIANSPTLHRVASGGDRGGVSAFTLQPVNAKPTASLADRERALPRQVKVKTKKKPVSIPPPPDRPSRAGVERTTTTSTTSAESSGSSFRPHHHQQRASSRGRSVSSSTRDNNSATCSSSRGRSKSRSRPDAAVAAADPQHDEKRERSSSRQRSISDHPRSSSSSHRSSSSSTSKQQQQPLENQPREKSRGRSRPPVTRNGRDVARSSQHPSQTHRSSSANNARDRSRPRARSRSASLTRVTSPHPSISPIPVVGITSLHGGDHHTDSSAVRHLPPPPTHRTREETRKRSNGGGNSSNSNNNNNTNNNSSSRSSRLNPDDRSLDINIGRDITFGPPKTSPSSVSSGNRKKTGLLGKLFGDQVDRKTKTFNEEIRPRILLAATVYHNTATNLWITTINTNQRGVAKNPTLANKYLKAFSFSTEHEARESAIANAPPKMVPFSESPSCFVCKGNFAVFRRASHCRNCGVCVCKDCAASWPAKMIPDTYNLKNEAHVRVCRSCFGLSTSFKAALMDGDYEQAIALYGTGNVNLRTPFPVTNKKDEIMYPVHCAIEGGNIHIVRWLIDDHYCPIKMIRPGTKKARRGSPECLISTSKGRHVLSIAIQRLKVDIIRYLVVDCGVSIHESTDLEGSLRALEATLLCLPGSTDRRYPREDLAEPRWDNASFDDISEPSTLGVGSDRGLLDNDLDTVGSTSNRTKNASESCIICCDRKIDCVATPCGHQVCCLECSSNLASCPVCNNRGEFIRIFKP